MTSPRERKGPRARAWGALKVVLYVAFLVAVAEVTLVLAPLPPAPPSVTTSYEYVPYVEHVAIGDRAAGPFRPTSGPQEGAPELWVFGGSTVVGGFGAEVSDCEPSRPCSLPSHLGEALRQRGIDVVARNYGQFNYVSTQERILFEQLLLFREAPAIAVFYHGVNDSEHVSEVVGFPPEYAAMRRNLEYRGTDWGLQLGLQRARFRLAFFLDWLINGEKLDPLAPPVVPWGAPQGSVEETATELARYYAANTRMIRALCREWGVECFFAWQPWGCTKDPMGPTEARWSEEMSCGPSSAMHDAIVSQTALATDPRFRDLSDVFDGIAEDIFLDNIHVDEASEGHVILARELAEWIAGELAP